jgi:hypothetical protein
MPFDPLIPTPPRTVDDDGLAPTDAEYSWGLRHIRSYRRRDNAVLHNDPVATARTPQVIPSDFAEGVIGGERERITRTSSARHLVGWIMPKSWGRAANIALPITPGHDPLVDGPSVLGEDYDSFARPGIDDTPERRRSREALDEI